MRDYLTYLQSAHRVVKAEQPTAIVVGGIGCSPRRSYARAFVEAGGLRWVDVMDIHVYDSRYGLEQLETALRELGDLMRKRGEVRPIWITEFGVYADDDPACVPSRVGDATMQRCARPSEREASADLVKLMAMFTACGVDKVFLHAGTCAPINRPDAGGIFFEYGGVPRKMLPAAAVLARLLVPGSRLVRRNGLAVGITSYTFNTPDAILTVAWSSDGTRRPVTIPQNATVLDIMGNRLSDRPVRVSDTPIYLCHPVRS